MRKYVLVTIICLAISLTGCAFLKKEFTRTADGQAPIEKQLKEGQKYTSLIPGYGTIVSGGFGILLLVANGIVSVMAKRRGTAVNAVVAGVEQASINYKTFIDDVMKVLHDISPAAESKVQAELDNLAPMKDTISIASKALGISDWLHNRIQTLTKLG